MGALKDYDFLGKKISFLSLFILEVVRAKIRFFFYVNIYHYGVIKITLSIFETEQ